MLWIIFALLLFLIQIGVIVFSEYRRPQKAVTWVVISFVFPFIGYLLYYSIGQEYSCNLHPHPKERTKLARIKEKLKDRCKRRMSEELLDQTIQQNDTLHATLKKIVSLPINVCNETIVYSEGEQAFEAMLESITRAKHHIHIQFYIIRDDQLGTKFQQLLIQKAQERVKVRFLYDRIGSRRLGKTYLKQLQEAGVETGCFSPLLPAFISKRINYRNHRKTLVVDGKIGYIGGLNIGDEYVGKNPKIGYWRDTHFRLKGDAVLWIQYAFLTDWFFVKGKLLTDPVYFPEQESEGRELVQIVKSSPDETILELIFFLINSARKRIYIESPYFILDPGILLALKTAVSREVDVQVIIPTMPESNLVYSATLSYARELMEAGVRFHCYKKGFIHAKVIITDDLACSGTANMDMRSFYDQFEINAVFFDEKVVDRLVQDFYRDRSGSEEIFLSEFKNRPWFHKVREAFARLLSSLF
ncbi:cardiolipin synthase [Brevibacillus daliensis]|uniref:cardiolipin synthase n=1 Tax=Brevibacillus daliensis TaxID=2892995 RepID=UPI001E612A33|nr:cardiolipin synthase [Brevibacillus daliensis]